MTAAEHYRRAEQLAWAALGPTDPDGEVIIDLGEHVAYLSRADAIALADVYVRLAEIAMPTRGEGAAMSPSEHYREAEKLLANARIIADHEASHRDEATAGAALYAIQQLTARAAVHAALAAISVPATGRETDRG